MLELLLPLTDILTPNSLEARRLAQDLGPASLATLSLAECARRLIGAGAAHVLVTGTHEHGARVRNVLYGSHGPLRHDEWERLPGSYHGSGCTLASAIAANLARGEDVATAVGAAQQYTWQSLAHGFRPGMGQLIPHRLWHGQVPMRSQPNPSTDATQETAHVCIA